jgi:DNA-binding NtrC family response regulator
MTDLIQVLHVEDDRSVAAAIRLLLQSAGMAVASVATPAEALRCLAVEGLRPDVLLFEYWLGDRETGADLAEHIARALGYRVPTIILSGQLFNAEVPWIPGTPIMLASKPMDDYTLIDTITHFAGWQRSARSRVAESRVGLPGAAA